MRSGRIRNPHISPGFVGKARYVFHHTTHPIHQEVNLQFLSYCLFGSEHRTGHFLTDNSLVQPTLKSSFRERISCYKVKVIHMPESRISFQNRGSDRIPSIHRQQDLFLPSITNHSRDCFGRLQRIKAFFDKRQS